MKNLARSILIALAGLSIQSCGTENQTEESQSMQALNGQYQYYRWDNNRQEYLSYGGLFIVSSYGSKTAASNACENFKRMLKINEGWEGKCLFSAGVG